jgi:hypothetical protein
LTVVSGNVAYRTSYAEAVPTKISLMSSPVAVHVSKSDALVVEPGNTARSAIGAGAVVSADGATVEASTTFDPAPS